MDLKELLAVYERQFRENDQEYTNTDIPNKDAFSFLLDEIPRVELPDKDLERVYYFRFWVYRKHIRNTPRGHIITEFLPDVPWAGAFNSINCATPFHLLEGRWLKDSNGYLKEYIDFFLDDVGDAFSYSMSFVSAVSAYAEITRIVSETLSPFDADEEPASEKPSTEPPRFNMAASKLKRVRVLGS